MQVTFKVRRYDPDSDRPVSRFEEYTLEMTESNTVLDGLIRIREEVDGTLALRCSCRSAICGSCAMRINGQAGLACNTLIITRCRKTAGPIVVEPAGNLRGAERPHRGLPTLLEQGAPGAAVAAARGS